MPRTTRARKSARARRLVSSRRDESDTKLGEPAAGARRGRAPHGRRRRHDRKGARAAKSSTSRAGRGRAKRGGPRPAATFTGGPPPPPPQRAGRVSERHAGQLRRRRRTPPDHRAQPGPDTRMRPEAPRRATGKNTGGATPADSTTQGGRGRSSASARHRGPPSRPSRCTGTKVKRYSRDLLGHGPRSPLSALAWWREDRRTSGSELRGRRGVLARATETGNPKAVPVRTSSGRAERALPAPTAGTWMTLLVRYGGRRSGSGPA